MNNNLAKTAVRRLCFRPGAIRTIRLGPLRGMVFRCGPITGLSPWYSGTERAHQAAFCSFLQPGDVVADVGANWGLHTLYMSRLVGADGLVLSVEPFPPALADLQWHVEANGCRNVRILSLAVSDENAQAEFFSGNSASTGSIANVGVGSGAANHSFTVRTRTLDSLMQDLDGCRPLRLVKIDVEGAERRVLAGGRMTLKTIRPYLVIDLHTPEQDVLVARLLIENGYKLSRLTGPPILNPRKGWPDQTGVWGSILAAPSN